MCRLYNELFRCRAGTGCILQHGVTLSSLKYVIRFMAKHRLSGDSTNNLWIFIEDYTLCVFMCAHP